jgi:translation initiation factor 2B subunit (eIF-2B alpha/beta/delta family)
MFSTLFKKTTVTPALVLFAGSFAAVPNLHAQDLRGPTTVVFVTAEVSDTQLQASEFLNQIRDSAVALSNDSDRLQSLMNSRVTRYSYADSLNRIKHHINQTGEQLAQFEEIRRDAAPWQQEAVDRITPIAQQIAENTEAAIDHLNESPNWLYSPTYTNSLTAIADDAQQMKNNVSDFLALAKAQQKVDDLQVKILSSES